MKRFMLLVVIMLLASVSVVAEAEEAYAEIDQEMIALLALDDSQAIAYVAIIKKQRQLFLALKAREWEQELAFYQQTFTLLKSVLSSKQHEQFVAIIDSVIEDAGGEELLVLGDEYN